MAELDDMALVREFAAGNSDQIFATLVGRHINLVYSVALRRLGNPHHAEEVTQAVFLILAKKAPGLSPRTVLSGWLYQTAQLTAANFQRAARRRQRREQEAQMQFMQESEPDVSWQRLAPLLEEAMARLGEQERNAVVLHFFENRTVCEVAAALHVKEAAAQKRVNRATEKMRKFFVRRGVPLSAAVLMAAIGTNAVQAAPAALSSTVTGAVAMKGAVMGGTTPALIKSTLKLMAWAKVKTAAVVGAGVLLAAGTTAVVISEAGSPPLQLGDLPPEARAQWEKQKAAMTAAYFELTQDTAAEATGSQAAYSYSETNTVYLEGKRFYMREQARDQVHELAFDGTIIYRGQLASTEKLPPGTFGIPPTVTKLRVADKTDPLYPYSTRIFPYFDAASLYAPGTTPAQLDQEAYTSLEPLPLNCLEQGAPTQVEEVDGKLRVTFQVQDRWLSNARNFNVEQARKLADNGANTPEFVSNEVENVKRMQSLTPTRTMTFLLDPKNGYRVDEREEWTAAGQRIVRVVSHDWKHYDGPDLWLPGRCVAYYYTKPPMLKDFSDTPVMIVTSELKLAEFGRRNQSFALNYTEPGTHVIDHTTREAQASSRHQVELEVAANGALVRPQGRMAMPETNKSPQLLLWLVAGVIVLGSIIILAFRQKEKIRKN